MSKRIVKRGANEIICNSIHPPPGCFGSRDRPGQIKPDAEQPVRAQPPEVISEMAIGYEFYPPHISRSRRQQVRGFPVRREELHGSRATVGSVTSIHGYTIGLAIAMPVIMFEQ
jgi:hypothetical protein